MFLHLILKILINKEKLENKNEYVTINNKTDCNGICINLKPLLNNY